MSRPVFGILAKIVVVLALMLGGLPSARSNPMTGHSSASGMVMAPGMPMHHQMGAKKSPAKHMPCCGEDGCCVAGPCATAFLLPPSGWIERVGQASEIAFERPAGPGITVPPSLRPPISRFALS